MGSAVDNVDIISSLLSENLLLNPQDLRRKGHMIIDFLADYYENIENYPVRSQVEPGYLSKRVPESAPFNPEPIETILEDIQNDIIPGLSHWQSPNHFAYFPCAVSTAGILGELLSAGFNVVGLSWVTSPAATELESIVMNWLGKLLQLPKSFLFSSSSLSSSSSVIDDNSNNIDDNKVGGGGVMLGTTCEAILCTIVAARDQMLNKIGTGNIDKLVVYGSDQTHCGFQKSAKIAGINPRNIRAITTSKATDYSLCPTAFMSTVLSDIESGLIPLYLCTTVGTTPTTAIDPIGPLCKVAKEYNIWVHIDAAYAGSACICPEFRHLIDGVEEANSFSLNAHKWLFTSLDCCCLWVKDSSALIRALSTNPEYLKNKATESKKVIDYKDWQIALSRRFRSMKLWLVLRSYGVTNLRKFLRNCIEMAKQFEKLIVMDKRFEIVVPRTLSMVCFRLKQIKILDDKKMNKRIDSVEDEGMILNQMNRKLLESINASGRVYMTHAMIEDVYIIRFAVGGTLTEEQHVHSAWKVIQEHTDAMLGALNSK